MSETPYTETVTPEELSGEHIGLAVRAKFTAPDGTTAIVEGPVVDIRYKHVRVVKGREKEISGYRVNGAQVMIGDEWWDLEFVRFHYDAAAIRTRRGPDNYYLPEGYVDRVTEWQAKHAQAGEEAGGVTIPRDTYNILVATYKTYQQIGQAIGAMGETPKLRPEDVEALDQA